MAVFVCVLLDLSHPAVWCPVLFSFFKLLFLYIFMSAMFIQKQLVYIIPQEGEATELYGEPLNKEILI